jgi:hypothetical protein
VEPGRPLLRNLVHLKTGNAPCICRRIPSKSIPPDFSAAAVVTPAVGASSSVKLTSRATLSAALDASNSITEKSVLSANARCARRLRNSVFAAIVAVRHFAVMSACRPPANFNAIAANSTGPEQQSRARSLSCSGVTPCT